MNPVLAGREHAIRPLYVCVKRIMVRPMMTLRAPALALLPAFMLLAACGSGSGDAGPGGVTENEAEALDEAAEMIEQRRAEPTAQPSESETPAGEPSPAAEE